MRLPELTRQMRRRLRDLLPAWNFLTTLVVTGSLSVFAIGGFTVWRFS